MPKNRRKGRNKEISSNNCNLTIPNAIVNNIEKIINPLDIANALSNYFAKLL